MIRAMEGQRLRIHPTCCTWLIALGLGVATPWTAAAETSSSTGSTSRSDLSRTSQDHTTPSATHQESPPTAPPESAVTIHDLLGIGKNQAVTSSAKPSGDEPLAGYIFGVPVSVGNYYFAKRVSYTFPRPWEEGLSAADRERAIWEALILHYESFRRDVTVSEEELTKRIDSVLKDQQQSFTKAKDPAAYATWVKEKVGEEVELFENQMRYLFQIDKLKDQVRAAAAVTVSEEEMQQEFLNEQHHVGGEMVTYETREQAQAFYERVKGPAEWEAMKAKGDPKVRPVSLMTLEAYMDLWGIPKEQIYAFHALPLGSVGPPMPFGKQWCVYRLLDKRIGDLADFPKQRDAYHQKIKTKKQYEALKQWIEDLKTSAQLKVLPLKP